MTTTALNVPDLLDQAANYLETDEDNWQWGSYMNGTLASYERSGVKSNHACCAMGAIAKVAIDAGHGPRFHRADANRNFSSLRFFDWLYIAGVDDGPIIEANDHDGREAAIAELRRQATELRNRV